MNQVTPEFPPQKPATWALILGFALVYTSWGTTYLAIQVGVRDEQLPPALFGGVRVCLAGLVLLGYLALRGQPLSLSRRDWVSISCAGVLLFVGGNGLVTLAERTVSSGITAVLVATTPLWIGLLEVFWPGGERLTSRGWLGLLIGLGGVLVLLVHRFGNVGLLWGETGPLLVLASACSWALGSLVLRHRRLACGHLTAAAYQMIVGGGALSLLGAGIGEIEQLPDRVTAGAAGSFVYLLIVSSLVGFVSFNWLLGHVPAAKVGTYAYVNPVVAVFVGWLLANEEITTGLVAAVIIILTGVALVRTGEKTDTDVECVPDPAHAEDVALSAENSR